jgi:hypothetical protein
LKGLAFDLSLPGFELGQLALLNPSPLEDPQPRIDEADELLRKWKVTYGQVWEIGTHRLLRKWKVTYGQAWEIGTHRLLG